MIMEIQTNTPGVSVVTSMIITQVAVPGNEARRSAAG